MKETTEEERPRHVGPYRLDACLGRGGLGEVYRAWDERLERWVAVKRLHGESDATSRARFLREARAAARLSHPAIVQVFDVLEHDGVGWIVMEMVDGTDLGTLLSDGPLGVDVAIDYARQVAEGLAVAHAAGIVHRDLKSQNVMALTPPDSGSGTAPARPSASPASTGQASAGGAAPCRIKIVDFGLAKARPLHETDGESTAASLPGKVMGTPRCMSPEQALGRAVDFRTDLFALGVLLYELLTGRSPFSGKTFTETVSRVITHKPPPLEGLNPHVPPALAELVFQLLEKEPLYRGDGAAAVAERLAEIASGQSGDAKRHDDPLSDVTTLGASLSAVSPSADVTSADDAAIHELIPVVKSREKRLPGAPWIVAATLAVAGAAFVWRSTDWQSAADTVPRQRLVAVLKVDRSAETPAGENMDDLAYTVRHALVRALSSFETLMTSSAKEIDAVSGPPSAVARAVGAEEVLESILHCRDSECSLEVRRLDGLDSRIVGVHRFKVPPVPLLEATRAVEIGVRREIYPEEKLRPGVSEIETTPEDFTAFVAIRRAFDWRPGTRESKILRQQLEALQKRSPRFVEAAMLETKIAVHCYQETGEPALLERALERATWARTLAPENPQVLLELAHVEIQGGRLQDAEQILESLEKIAPGDIGPLDARAVLHDKRGETAAGLAFARMALERRPSWQRLHRHARLAMELGQIDLARQSLTQLLEQNPEHVDGLSMLAKLELVNGDPRQAAELYKKLNLLASTPGRQANLGLAYMLQGAFEAAGAAFEKADEMAPNNPEILLNLADSRWFEGRFEEARDLYRRILTRTPSEPDVDQLMWYAQALAHLGHGDEAVAAVRKALTMTPETQDIAFEAALVFTLADRPAPALAHAKRAMELGYDRRWFTLPWFDDLHAHPGFAAVGARNP